MLSETHWLDGYRHWVFTCLFLWFYEHIVFVSPAGYLHLLELNENKNYGLVIHCSCVSEDIESKYGETRTRWVLADV